jgi:hypothetical protein
MPSGSAGGTSFAQLKIAVNTEPPAIGLSATAGQPTTAGAGMMSPA